MVKDCSDCTLCRFNHLYVLGHDATLPRTPSEPSASSQMEDHNDHIGRFLRITTILAWIPAFPFLLVHGIIADRICPVLGIIPMTFSAITAVVHLTGGGKNRIANLAVDFFNAAFLIGVLIPSWIILADYWGSDAGKTMVGTYGTVPMMINFVIHIFFVLRDLRLKNPFWTSHCPHCHGDLTKSQPQQHPRAMSHVSSDSKESYHPVTMVDDDHAASPAEGPSYNHHDSKQPRPSTDDETARLV